MLATIAAVALGLQPAHPAATFEAFDHGLTPTRILHIAPHGNDSSGDGSEERPYATLRIAARHATPGAALRLAPGDYSAGIMLTDLAGAPQAPIWIGGEPGSGTPVTITGPDRAEAAELPRLVGGGSALHVIRAHHIIIHDLEITAATGNGLNCDDGGDRDSPDAAHHLVFRNLHIHDIGGDGNQDGLKLSGLHDFQVINCRISRCGGDGSGSGIDMVGCHRGLIAGCLITDLSANAIQAKGGTADIDIQWCRITNPGHRGVNIGGSTGFQYFRPPLVAGQENAEARRIRVRRNIFEGGITPVAFAGAVDCEVSHNTMIRPGKWAFRILQETRGTEQFPFAQCGDNRFEANLVVFERARWQPRFEVNVGAGTKPESFVVARNLWYAFDEPGRSRVMLPVEEAGGVVGLDPMLADSHGGEYRLTAGSPAIGLRAAGERLSDIEGKPPSQAGAAGAFEP